jgi:hypothetical protein
VRWMFVETDAGSRLPLAPISCSAELFRGMRDRLPVRLIDKADSYPSTPTPSQRHFDDR